MKTEKPFHPDLKPYLIPPFLKQKKVKLLELEFLMVEQQFPLPEYFPAVEVLIQENLIQMMV
jgi:hypothetical protein